MCKRRYVSFVTKPKFHGEKCCIIYKYESYKSIYEMHQLPNKSKILLYRTYISFTIILIILNYLVPALITFLYVLLHSTLNVMNDSLEI